MVDGESVVVFALGGGSAQPARASASIPAASAVKTFVTCATLTLVPAI